MSKIYISLALLSSSFFVAYAGDVKSASSIKIKVLEGKKTFESLEGKEREAKINKEKARLEQEIKALAQEIEADENALRTKARTVDPDKLEQDQAKIMKKRKEAQLKAEAAQEEFSRTANKELVQFNKKIQEAVIDIAKKNDLDLVVLKETSEIIYASPRLDISNEVVKTLDATYKSASAPKVLAPVKPLELKK